MQLCLTILILPPHQTRNGALHNSLKQLFRIRNNDVLHFCHIRCLRTARAITHFPILFASHQEVINKVMIEHTSNVILTFCNHVGDDISTPSAFRFHYSIAKC